MAPPPTSTTHPVEQCPHCDQPYPAELRGSAEEALARRRVPRPSLLTVGMYGSGILGVLMLLGVFGVVVGEGEIAIGGEAVSGQEIGTALLLNLSVLGAACLAICYGLWRERSWTRPLMLLYWVLVTAITLGQNLGTAPTVVVVSAVLTSAVFYLGAATAYLYFKQNVVAYYRSLAEGRPGRAA